MGEYMLVAKSKATNSSSTDQVDELLASLYEPIISFDMTKYKQLLNDFIDFYYATQRLERDPIDADLNELKARRDSLRYYRRNASELADSILNSMPHNSPFVKWIYHFGLLENDIAFKESRLIGLVFSKVKLQKIKIESDKTSNTIIDFGITYL